MKFVINNITSISKALTFLLFLQGSNAFAGKLNMSVDQAMVGEHRSEAAIKRNKYRHPKQTLAFFEVKHSMTVVEIWPSGGWYAEILAPYLRDKGAYYAAGFATSANRTPQWRKNMVKKLAKKFEEHPNHYDKTIVTELSIPERTAMAPEGSADRVLTFRNVHNWMKGEYAQGMFDAMFLALKPGGQLGLVEHRAKPGTSLKSMIKSGYVTEAHVIALAEKAGFKLLAKSEVNANSKDNANHPKGVWTLPPSLRLKEKDKEKYLSIGESDRMTLRFVKPATQQNGK